MGMTQTERALQHRCDRLAAGITAGMADPAGNDAGRP